VSDQAEQIIGETGSTGAGPTVPNSSMSAPEATEPAKVDAEAASLVPDAAPEASAPKAESVKPDPVKAEPVKETAKSETPRQPGKLLIMSPADRDWHREEAAAQPQAELDGKTRS